MANGTSMTPNNIHETGQPDTPIEVLTNILGRARTEEDPKALRRLVEEAYKLTAGLDPYLEKCSTPPSAV